MAARRVVADFAAVYGIGPVLAETFVAPEYRGSCFLAAGWRCVGHTSGRRLRDGVAEPAKRVLVLPLAADWHDRLGARRILAPSDGLDGAHWARNEFGSAALGDARLTQRLVRSAEIDRLLARKLRGTPPRTSNNPGKNARKPISFSEYVHAAVTSAERADPR